VRSPSSLQRTRRASNDINIEVSIGNTSQKCGPQDMVCNGPLDSSATYGVRYTLFSGDESQPYPFFDGAEFTTGERGMLTHTCIHVLDVRTYVYTCMFMRHCVHVGS